MDQDPNQACPITTVVNQPSYLAYGDMMRILGAIAVAFIHVTEHLLIFRDPMSRADWWFCNFVLSSTRWAVPVFVMLSGALLLDTSRKESPGVFYRKRFRRVGIPLVFWSAFYLAYEAAFAQQGLTVLQRLRGLDLHQALRSLLLGQPAPHLYFMFAIAGLYLCTPVMRICVKNSTRKELLSGIAGLFFILVAANLAASFAYYGWMGGTAFDKFVPYTGYFLLGYYLKNVTLSRKAFILVCAACVGSMGLTALGTGFLTFTADIGRERELYFALSPTIIVTSITVFLIIGNVFSRQSRTGPGDKSVVHRIASATLGVYLIHPAFAWRAHDLGMTAWFDRAWVSIPIITLFVLVVSYAAAVLIGRIPYVRAIVGDA